MKRLLRVLPIIVVCILCSKVQAQTIILDDFSGPRANAGNDGLPIFYVYTGEDPGQTYTIGGGIFRVSASPSAGMYWHFVPYPYTGPQGFAKGWIAQGAWNADINRLKFSFSCDRNISNSGSGYGTVQIGTYVKLDDGQPDNQGAHYYHHIDPNIYSGKTVYVDINRTPTHKVGQDPNINWPQDPTWPSFHYFDGLTRWYFDTQDGNWSGATCQFRSVTFQKTPGEPDQQVYSVTYQYTGSRYEVAWGGPKNSTLKFDVAYSTQSMHTNGFVSGTSGGTISATGNAYTVVQWASPNMAESSTGMYIAIRPQGGSAFTEVFVPNSSGATTPPPPTASVPAAPTGLAIQ